MLFVGIVLLKIYLYFVEKSLYKNCKFYVSACLIMKKFTFFLFLLPVFIICGCGNKENVQEEEIEEVDVMSADIDVESCDDYFELVKCVIDRTTNQNWTKEMKNELRLEMKAKQEERKKMSKEDLDKTCSDMLNHLYISATDLDELWCLD